MPQPVRVIHETDPKQDIMEDVGPFIGAFTPLSDRILIVMYERGKRRDGNAEVRSRGGIIVPQKSLDEDKFQGRVGLVMRMGALAFADDNTHHWGDPVPRIGDWVMVRVGDTSPFDLPNDRRARYVHDADVEAIISQDGYDLIW